MCTGSSPRCSPRSPLPGRRSRSNWTRPPDQAKREAIAEQNFETQRAFVEAFAASGRDPHSLEPIAIGALTDNAVASLSDAVAAADLAVLGDDEVLAQKRTEAR